MAHAPTVPSSSSSALFVETVHACARHPEMRGEQGCVSCSAALCTACARSLAHRTCPSCRAQQGAPAHAVDVSWRALLLFDSLVHSARGVVGRAPALLGIFAVGLTLTLALVGNDPELADSEAGQIGAFAAFFTAFATGIGFMFQPLIVFPTHTRARVGRILVAGLVACGVAVAPVVLGAAAVAVTDDAFDLSSDSLGLAAMLLGLFFCGVSMPVALWWQGAVALGKSPTLRGLVGALVAHAVVAMAWATVLSVLWIPLALVIALASVAGAIVAGVVGVVCGVSLWLFMLIGMGAFAAGTARYGEDLRHLRG